MLTVDVRVAAALEAVVTSERRSNRFALTLHLLAGYENGRNWRPSENP